VELKRRSEKDSRLVEALKAADEVAGLVHGEMAALNE
jgi:hypothetical protein